MWRLIVAASALFKLWMFVDANRRPNVSTAWLWGIMVVPFGEWAYFFLVKLRDPGSKRVIGKVRERLAPPASIESLRRDLAFSDTIVHRVRLAQGLYDAGEHDEASDLFRSVLVARPEDADALYGLGVTAFEQNDFGGAIGHLSKLVEKRPAYRDFAAFAVLAEAYFCASEPEHGVELLRDLYRTAPRLGHAMGLAQALLRVDRRDEAATVLERALAERERDPWRARLRSHREAALARRRLSELQATAAAGAASLDA